MNADSGHFQLALEGTAIEGLDVLQLVAEGQLARVDLVVGEGVEHEGVAGVGAVADGDQPLGPNGFTSGEPDGAIAGRLRAPATTCSPTPHTTPTRDPRTPLFP